MIDLESEVVQGWFVTWIDLCGISFGLFVALPLTLFFLWATDPDRGAQK